MIERYHLEDPVLNGKINNKMDLQEGGCGGMNWTDLVQDRDRWRALVKTGNGPSGSIKYGEFVD
jgi:hypothetical protein